MSSSGGNATVCPSSTNIVFGSKWFSTHFDIHDLSDYVIPSFILELFSILVVNRSVNAAIEPLGFPSIVADLIGCTILLGPTVLGKIIFKDVTPENISVTSSLRSFLFPSSNYLLLEFIGSMGLTLYALLVALQLDVHTIKVAGKKVAAIGTASILLPLFATTIAAVAFGLPAPMADSSFGASDVEQTQFVILLAFALSTTAFPVLGRFLEEVKIPDTEISPVIMPSALLGNVEAWVAIAVCFGFSSPADETIAPLLMLLAGTAFVGVCVFLINPALTWIARRMPEGELELHEYAALVIIIVLIAWLGSETMGFHSVFGGLIVGLVVPRGPLTKALIYQLDYLVVGLMIPFQIMGISQAVDMTSILTRDANEPSLYVLQLLCVMVVATLGKVAAGMLTSSYCSMSRSQGLSIGIFMSTMGPIQMMILNTGKKENVFNEKIYSMLLIGSLATTLIASSRVWSLNNKRSRGAAMTYEQRNLMQLRPDSELRVVACIHTVHNVPSIMSLLQLSNRSSLFVYAINLVELIGNNPPMLIVHDSDHMKDGFVVDGDSSTEPMSDRAQFDSEQIVSTLENYEQGARNFNLKCLTSISTCSSMPNDICNIAEDHLATLIVLPFHMLLKVDGGMEEISPYVRGINQDIIGDAPCSVAILVDRGLSDTNARQVSRFAHVVAVLFFGGPDDQEALMYASQFAGQPGVELTVVRFLANHEGQSSASAMSSKRVEQQLDDKYVTEFQLQFGGVPSVYYAEKYVRNSEETVAAIRSLASTFTFYVVGKASGGNSSLLSGMIEFMEFSELGPVGDILVSSEFSETASVLVVQQYLGTSNAWGAGSESRRKRRRMKKGSSSGIWSRRTAV